MAQERFWKELYQLKFQINVVEAHFREADKYDRWLKMFTAITSSASIGAWVIWRDLSLLWAGIIATSHVATAIGPHLPFKERRIAYSSMLHELEALFIQTELKWQDVATGQLSENEINKARGVICTQKQAVLKKHLPSSVVPDDPATNVKAEAISAAYFSNFYPV